jgi:hypothetical protein
MRTQQKRGRVESPISSFLYSQTIVLPLQKQIATEANGIRRPSKATAV